MKKAISFTFVIITALLINTVVEVISQPRCPKNSCLNGLPNPEITDDTCEGLKECKNNEECIGYCDPNPEKSCKILDGEQGVCCCWS
ncbi:hypothetical protein Hanom_Chr17g01528081 [Helianthus anomalus]